MFRIPLLASLLAASAAAAAPAPIAPTSPAPVPPLPAAEAAPATDLSVLPLTIPGYELRVLDQRKTLNYEAGGGHFEVHLPIFFYWPTAEERGLLQPLRAAIDELRRAAHRPDRNDYDFEKLLERFEQGLAAFGPRA